MVGLSRLSPQAITRTSSGRPWIKIVLTILSWRKQGGKSHHGKQHLGPEHATVANLHPLVKTRVEGENLHAEGEPVKYYLADFSVKGARKIIVPKKLSAIGGYPPPFNVKNPLSSIRRLTLGSGKTKLQTIECQPRFCVGIVGWLESELFNAELLEELVKNSNQVP